MKKWNPFTLSELSHLLEPSSDWFVDGGVSIDLILGRHTRPHGDLDIGVFSSNIVSVLSIIELSGYGIFIANGDLVQYKEENFNSTNYNYWISDGNYLKLQILVYMVDGENVLFRRNKKMYWPKSEMVLLVKGLPVLNPLVSYAFKVTTAEPEQKDIGDVAELMKLVSSYAK